MNIQDFLSIVIVGAALSGLVEFIKTKFGTTSGATRATTVVLALVIGGGYIWLQSTPYYQAVLGVLATASTVYAIIIKPLEA